MGFIDKIFRFKRISEKTKTMNNDQLPSLKNPIIDRNPPSRISEKGLTNLILRLRKISGLSQIYGGYNNITEPITHPLVNIGRTSTAGFDIDEINSMILNYGELSLCYIAFPINDMDDLIENPTLSDWDFEENFLKKIINTKTVPIGAIYFNNKTIKMRTIKFIVVK